MAKKRIDYHFENNKLKLVPLDLQQQFPRDEWIEKNQDISKWEELTIPDVTFIEFLGYGANGIVLKAKEDITDRVCAVKIWLPNTNSKHYSVYFEKYQEEIKKISHLDMASIVTIYKAGITEKGYCYSTMEWVEGLTLKKFLETNENLADDVRFKILHDILLTIHECHRINVLHGDLHCENILLEPTDIYGRNYKVKILDFGTSLLNRNTSEKYNKQRESALLLQTVLKLLPEEEKYRLLNFRFYSSLNPKKVAIKNSDDARNIDPIIVSSTLKKLCEIYALVESNYFNDAVFIDMLNLLLTSTHLDVQAVWNFICFKGNESDMNLLMYILSGNVSDYLFETNMHNHDIRTFELTLCYYELLKKNINLTRFKYNNQFDNFDVNTFDFEEILYLESLEDLLQFITVAKYTLNENDYIKLLTELFLTLGRKFEKEFEPDDKFKSEITLIFKLNELSLKRNYSIENILNWKYR
ncbi:protein kinase domain-containing protein [Bacillus tropicus]|uniref:Protein kinase n=1 Tax=Bacillus tropicus TaxID=2026188 RepID=A0ABD7ZVW3_9BACI|nr:MULTISPECIES: protein kinase [Bacillus]AUG88599.1 hypothetical protein [Bacillus phage BVE2]MCU4999499.1 protein kinase [Bacillus tropicus]UBM49727.1 protein kinase [Bacillus sp. CRB-7]WMY17156.1 protein kinase [Bacillus tropicus]